MSSPYSAQRRETRSRISSDMTISSGHGRASSSGQLVRRVDPELAAVELASGCMIEMVERTLRDQDVALRVDVRRDAEEHVRVVVDVHIRVDHDDRLRQREHPEPPQRVHDLLRMARKRLADGDDDAVVESARDRQVVVDDLGKRHADGRQEDPLRRLAEPRVLGRRLADDDRGVDRIAAHRDRAEAEDRKRLGVRVVARVVAERALDADVVFRHVALEHDLRVRGHLEVDRLALDELDRLAAEKACEHELVEVLRQRRARRVRRDGIEPDRDGNRNATVLGREEVGAAVLVHLPVHERRRAVDDLHPIHADVPRPRLRVLRDDGREGDERRRVARPAALDGEAREIDVGALEEDLLTRCLAHHLRPRVRNRLELEQPLHLLADALGRLHVEDVAELGRGIVERVDPERHAHALLGPELVDQERVLRALRVLEEKRRPTGLDDPVDDLGDLEVGVGLCGDAPQLALALEERDPLAEISRRRRQGEVSLWTRARPQSHPRARGQAQPGAYARARLRGVARFASRDRREKRLRQPSARSGRRNETCLE